MSEAGFEPMPTIVDYDLNVALRLRPLVGHLDLYYFRLGLPEKLVKKKKYIRSVIRTHTPNNIRPECSASATPQPS